MQPITIKVNQQNKPCAFRWKKRQYPITEIIDEWREAGQWWLGEPERHVYRVLTSTGGLYELHQAGGRWYLSQVFD
ncbi:MAG: DUF6504 family protein [Limnochordia bacterium]|jgi:hypothetical protein